MWRMSSKGVRRAENLTRGPPRVWQGQEAVTTLRDGGQRDEGMLSEPRSQGCQAGVGSERGHSLCWKCCPSEGWGRHPGSSLPPMFHLHCCPAVSLLGRAPLSSGLGSLPCLSADSCSSLACSPVSVQVSCTQAGLSLSLQLGEAPFSHLSTVPYPSEYISQL